MKFTVDRDRVIHIGSNNVNYSHTLLSSTLRGIIQGRELGVSSLKSFVPCTVATKKANRMLRE